MTRTRRKAVDKALADPRCNDIRLYGLAGSATAVALYELLPVDYGAPMVIVADSLDDAGYLHHDLIRLAGEEAVAILPSGYRRDIRFGIPDAPQQILRVDALSRLASDPKLRFVVTYPEALAEGVAERKALADATVTFTAGATMDLTATMRRLRELGFKETDYVYEPGQFARRGSILDIFGYSNELPYRIDLFGDEIDSIRTFDIETQLSAQKLTEVSVTANVADEPSQLSLLDFVPERTVVALRDAGFTLARIRALSEESLSDSARLADEEDIDRDAMKRLVEPVKVEQSLAALRRIHFTAAAMPPDKYPCSIDFGTSPQTLYHKNFDLIADSFRHFLSEGLEIFILTENAGQADRLRAIFAERGDAIAFTPVEATLHEGFVDPAAKMCVFTDHQIFDRFHKYTLKSDRARSGKLALSLKELQSIEPGDFIVHVDHGVGRFDGLVRNVTNGRVQEAIKLTYANDDTLFVSIHSLHKLAKYRGKEGVPPKINKLGSGAWTRIKQKTKDKLKDIARDLIKLYAARLEQKGHAFPPDSYLQHELEASFIYEDTPDQATATAAVKADMEAERPMDRLICGDVGFGKTEIAIRAAFKAATDGKQTAVLVPTTVLAYQHFDTFSRRLKEFPVRVEYISRARTAAHTRQILADLEAGKIDIIIGTHKLIGKSVKFKDLGLLVVDEEQKFGVAVKERLKQLKTSVDTLTMSATPIPRTLQFSLMGARDLSSINTPPPNRYPILTTVDTLSDELLVEAINFEMARNGQVFIVNPRIEGLMDLEARVRRLVPDARTVVGHGQMSPETLEKTIIDFAAHDYDILLATTIIESGIDMPRVNTIIINDAHKFGLSELHQLRGRVGRSSRKAFCYLLTPPGLPLTPTARRRLQAIESFSDLGSGIHIAMQDLDIRGAGNLLGAEQSGFIADLGYETYQRILKEAVTELRTQEFPDLVTTPGKDDAPRTAVPDEEFDFVADTVIESDMELLLPPTYVPHDSERIALYRELDAIERETDLLAFRARLVDRFGKMPREAAELLRIPTLRGLAKRLGIEKVVLKQDTMYLYLVGDDNRAYYNSIAFGRILSYLSVHTARTRLRQRDQRRSIAIAGVKTVEEAVSILNEITSLTPPGA
ncbi:MAG: transcription-repair coupling factor [Bacteroides sp.]|nr:transcription-repair coupling factor [Bacteroides sp.]